MTVRRYFVRAGIVLVGILIAWAITVSSKQLSRNQRIEDEVSLLQNEADKIRRENETLGEKISYFSSDNFREQEAKEKLGLQKKSEEVVVIKPRPESVAVSEKEVSKPTVPEVEDLSPNYKKWWQLLFGRTS